MAIGSRLRMLTETITEDAAGIYRLYGVDLQPKWFPVFYVLSRNEWGTVTEIAREIGHSHPSVSRILREMMAAGYVTEKKDKEDGRRNRVQLSARGKKMAHRIEDQYADVSAVIGELSEQSENDLWKAIEEWEQLLKQKSLLERVQERRKYRESESIQIVPYKKSYHPAFRSLNEEWISKYFRMEETDYKALDHPDRYILKKGGFILVALYKDEPVGVCALIPMKGEFDFELAKMAVSPKAQGKGIGWLLGKAAIEKARQQGASRIYLESNTILEPAIRLYEKLGFKKVEGHPTPYERCNIQMGMDL